MLCPLFSVSRLSAAIRKLSPSTTHIKQAGSLRGLRLVDVLNFDFDAVSTADARHQSITDASKLPLWQPVTSPRCAKRSRLF
jgi:hypothetical protein